MLRAQMVLLALVLAVTGCAHPDSIKGVSKDQEALLASFKTALDDIRAQLRTAFSDSIRDYKEARVRRWVVVETGSLSTQIVRCRQGIIKDCQGESAQILLDQAAQYLERGQVTLFGDFCASDGTWQKLKMSWMRRKDEQCPVKPQDVVRELEKLGNTLDSSLLKLSEDMASVQEAQSIIDAFLQVRIEIKEEDVAAAQAAVDKAKTAAQDTRAVLAEFGKGGAK